MPVPTRVPWKPRLILLGVVVGIFLISCALPVFYLDNGDTWAGWTVLLFGWIGLLLGQLGWLANFALLVGAVLLLCRCWISCAILSGIGVLIGLHTFTMLHQKIPLDEAGVNQAVLMGFGPAPYTWLGSMAVMGVGALILRSRR